MPSRPGGPRCTPGSSPLCGLPGSTHGWSHVAAARKRELIRAIVEDEATAGPAHVELDLTDRCNVACYFCNQQDTRSKLQLPPDRLIELVDHDK